MELPSRSDQLKRYVIHPFSPSGLGRAMGGERKKGLQKTLKSCEIEKGHICLIRRGHSLGPTVKELAFGACHLRLFTNLLPLLLLRNLKLAYIRLA
jgi:hypothetical protein